MQLPCFNVCWFNFRSSSFLRYIKIYS
jgi:hypothetical protein